MCVCKGKEMVAFRNHWAGAYVCVRETSKWLRVATTGRAPMCVQRKGDDEPLGGVW